LIFSQFYKNRNSIHPACSRYGNSTNAEIIEFNPPSKNRNANSAYETIIGIQFNPLSKIITILKFNPYN